ncbi:MAG: hypothetical protein HND58_03245 [Planctomycetota bacterium]|nr:MAG: hypothetical protein HND58_03245 [Planctomycetota bacterium]
MKGILGWIKSHLIMVVSTVVIVVSIPLGWMFSSKWNADIRAKQEQRVSQAYNKVKNAKVTYVIPSLLPGEQAVSETRAPNRYVTEFYAEQRKEREAQAAEVVTTVIAFNKNGHTLLAPELLPVPSNRQQETRLKYEFLDRMAGDPVTGATTIYRDLLRSIGAGEAPDPVKLATTIQDLQTREMERMIAESGAGSISPEEQEQLRKLLADRRLAEAQRRARDVSVFMTMAAFDPQAFGPTSAQIPPVDQRARPATVAPSLAEAFSWNFDYWVVSDLLRAIDKANTDAGGTRANVENALVKRVERIGVEALPLTTEEAAQEFDSFGQAIETETFEASSEGTDPSVSVTGRKSNAEYDVIKARMTLVVDAERLPRLFKAFSETNLITVLDMDVREVDLWADLRQGYYYGKAPVVRVDLELETVWHRDWTVPMMPQSVKSALGVVESETSDGGEG